MMSTPGVATKMFEALYDANINIQMINTSEIRVSPVGPSTRSLTGPTPP